MAGSLPLSESNTSPTVSDPMRVADTAVDLVIHSHTQAAPGSTASIRIHPTPKASILLVDDIASNRDFLVAVLTHYGYLILEADNGQSGLAIARAERPDLIITDVLMPVMDGYELLHQLRLDPATSAIPVVFYTAHYGEREARELAKENGVSYVLTKPVESATVLQVVARILAPQPATTSRLESATVAVDFDRRHMRLLTDKLSQKVGEVLSANDRLRSVINIGSALASEADPTRRLENVCRAVRDLFGATYATIGIVNRDTARLVDLHRCGEGMVPWIEPGDAVPGIIGRAITERRSFRGNNPPGDPQRLGLPALHPDAQAFVVAPIGSLTHTYGWICLVGNDGDTFTDEDEQLVLAIGGQVGRITELEQEIAERKEAEFASRRDRDRAQRFLDTPDVILLALDLQGRVTLVNRYACALLGWDADELLGRDWFDTCLPERIRQASRQNFHDLLAGHPSVVENPVRSRSGAEHMIEWHDTLSRDGDGAIIGTFSSGADVTERHRVVDSLRVAEERMRFALESAGVGIWDLDCTTGVTTWSPLLEDQYGIPRGSFAGTRDAFIGLIHPDDRAATIATITEHLVGGDFTLQNRAIWPDGSVHSLAGAGRIHLGPDGTALRGVGISMDVTDRRKLEDQYQQAQKMEAIGRLAGGVAHDFNNLLSVILGHCEILLADLNPQDVRQADIVEIQKAGSSAATLTRQLLAFSRKQIIEPTILDLNAVVTHLRAMIGRLIGEDVKVLLGLSNGLSAVKADRGQIEQIVLNLAVNARDAMPKGGTLTIETRNVELDDDYADSHLGVAPGSYVALIVSDTGVGMSAETQRRLFEPFYTTKEVGVGTGLGLATVHGVVTGSGGSVSVYSELGKGSSFTVYLPRVDGSSIAATTVSAATPVATGSETVLVVEDADGLRGLTRRLLERQGYTVLVAANATEAVAVFDENPEIDVILTDVVMPGGSGPDLAAKLVARRPSLKVIYMSGYTEDAIVQHGVLSSGIAFLHKPFTSAMLGQKIRSVIESRA